MRFATFVKGYQTIHLKNRCFAFMHIGRLPTSTFASSFIVKEPANGYYMHIDDPVKDFKKLNLKISHFLFVPGDHCVTFHWLCSFGNGESISLYLFGNCPLRL
jgi:hypothetical protein